MTEKTQPTSPMEPEDAMKVRPFTEEPDAEGHGLKFRPFTEDAPEAEGVAKVVGEPDAADTEGHMPLRKVGPAPAAPDEPGAPDTEAHVIKATEDAGIAPEGGRRSFTEGDDDAAGIEPDGIKRKF